MKELYTKPVTEVEKFETVDVLTTSPTQGNQQLDPNNDD